MTSLLDLPQPGMGDSLQSHRRFIKKVLTRPLNLRRANIFTLNYDTLIEQAGDAEGSVLVDGFVGTLRRIFRPESYDIDFYFPARQPNGGTIDLTARPLLYGLWFDDLHRCDPIGTTCQQDIL